MIRWENYVWRDFSPVITMVDIETLEKEWSIILPHEYKNILMEHQGKTPVPDGIKVGDGISNVCCLLTLTMDEYSAEYSLRKNNDLINCHLRSRVFPFARDGGGNWFCFDYRESELPSVVYLYPDEGNEKDESSFFIEVAGSFDSFLSALFNENEQNR